MHRKEEQQEDLAFFGNQERKQEELQSVETETETGRRSKKNRLFTKQEAIESLSCWGPFAKPRESWTDSFFKQKRST